MAESLNGKVAVISGVGSGFGKATAELFASSDQVSLVLIDHNEKALGATADACKAAGSKVVALAGDVTKPETFELALKESLDNFGRVDFLINYAGGALKVDLFTEGQKVDVSGTSIGKGFAGAVKRHHFSMQDATHGNSLAHRAPGSIGQNQTPGRVFKGQKMAGHMGNVRRTAENLVVVRVDTDRNLLLIKGAVPGHAGGKVIVRPAVKVRN